MPLPGPIPRPQGVESEIAHARQEEQERDWARHRAEDELEPHRFVKWWRRLFGDGDADRGSGSAFEE